MTVAVLSDGYDPREAYEALLGYPQRSLVPIGTSYRGVIVHDPRRTDVDVLIVFPSSVVTPRFSQALEESELPITELWFQREVSGMIGKRGRLTTRYLQSWEVGRV